MDEQTIARKLKLAESAAASAVLNGADPDEVRRRVEIGIAEAVESNARLLRSQEAAPPKQTGERSALSSWANRVSASTQ